MQLAQLVFLVWVVLGLCAPGAANAADETSAPRPALQRLTVQLSWTHQTQFAGFYMAHLGKYFEQEGLDVVLVPGNTTDNPIDAVRQGRADVTISTLRGALMRWDPAKPVTHVAQIFQVSPILVICRQSLGVQRPQDLLGKTIGTAGGGDLEVLRTLVRRLDPRGQITLVPRDGTGGVLVRGEAACITGVTFNELIRVQNAGVPLSDLVTIRPESIGVTDLGDGLYVAGQRLESEAFRQQLRGLLRALEKGWRDARSRPSVAVAATLERNPGLDASFQRQALEQVLELIPAEDFGLLKPEQAEAMALSLLQEQVLREVPPNAWSHRVWNEWHASDGTARALSPPTRHALKTFAEQPLFYWLVTLGTLMYGLGGALLGIERGYNLWGRLLMAVLPAIGGGVVRDLLIGGPRLPYYFIADPSLPIALLLIVLGTSALVAFQPRLPHTRGFRKTMWGADVIGSAVIATNGAIVALIANVPWVWAPVFAAISCAGGGLLLDIVTREHPRAFSGRLLGNEERGAISGAMLLLALWMANHQDHPDLTVYAGAVLAVGVNIVLRAKREAIAGLMPSWLSAQQAQGRSNSP